MSLKKKRPWLYSLQAWGCSPKILKHDMEKECNRIRQGGNMLQKRFVLFLVVILVIATASIYQFTATAETSLPPTPNYIPASINASPSSQTVWGPSYKAVWGVDVTGQGNNMCITVTWGDACGSATSCGYQDGDHVSYTHRFTCSAGNRFSQRWKLYRTPGGPAYDRTYVSVIH